MHSQAPGVNLFPQASPIPDRLIQLMAGRSDLQTTHPDFFVNAFDTSKFGRSEIVALPNSENPTRSGLIFWAEGSYKRTGEVPVGRGTLDYRLLSPVTEIRLPPSFFPFVPPRLR
jgi:hypothetical protein